MPSYRALPRCAKILLRKKNLWEIERRAEKLPENASDDAAKKLEKRQNEAAHEIGFRVGPQVLPRIMTAKTSARMWAKLKKIFRGRSRAQRTDLLSSLDNLQKKKNQCAASHATKSQEIGLKLQSLGRAPSEERVMASALGSLPNERSAAQRQKLLNGRLAIQRCKIWQCR